MLNKFIEWAEKNDWKIIREDQSRELPEEIRSRYTVPERWYDFIRNFRVCENSTGTKCFLTPGDYMPHGEDYQGFRWNEFELISLEAGDEDGSTAAYWDRHLPIIISVDGEYSYYAIDTQSGNIVSGFEPEFEDFTVEAKDFDSFLKKIISGDTEL